ncbi:hypothetical protein LUU34_00182000 [Aix galericulata]|nr:hypothetical protein LUU34_00182000 [Aix galericulata]
MPTFQRHLNSKRRKTYSSRTTTKFQPRSSPSTPSKWCPKIFAPKGLNSAKSARSCKPFSRHFPSWQHFIHFKYCRPGCWCS